MESVTVAKVLEKKAVWRAKRRGTVRVEELPEPKNEEPQIKKLPSETILLQSKQRRARFVCD